jgi:hypothetical protein
MEILKSEAGAQLDRDVVRAFEVYYSGRRSLRWWFVGLASFRQGVEALILAFQRWGFAGVANAAAVGSVAVAVAGGTAIQGQLPEKAAPHERQAIVREAKERDVKPVGLRSIAGDASDGTATEHAGDAVSRAGSQASSTGTNTERRPGKARSNNAYASTDSPGKSDVEASSGASDSASASTGSSEQPDQAGQAAEPSEGGQGPADDVVDKVKDVAGKVPGAGGK